MVENEVIVWEKNSFLTWSDFKAESNPAVFEDSHGVTKYRYTWTVNSDEIKDQVLFFIENIQLSVEFHPILSWVRISHTSDDLLKHEQGHFDLAELIKRENLKELQNKFHGKRFPTRGKNNEQRKQLAKEDSGKIIAEEVEKLELVLSNRNHEYDEQTNFGQNLTKQLEYNLTFNKLRS
ncbi:MAG TPA: hypothetical protein OQH54_05840 [Nitrosopumilus sp.]|nr:hypothetical protein [Thermoproteota archaeon]HJJ23216.1 hypothetical protein [Nitrosopumilus sp.]